MKADRFTALVAVGLLSFISAQSAWADNWPQWRGSQGDGICREKGLPFEWSETKNIAWKLKMPGMGSSTPAIWGDRLFLTSEDKNELELLCISTSGKELWRRNLAEGSHRRYQRGEGNDSSASPSTDGKHVYAFTGTGDLACFDLEGNSVWHFNAQDRYGEFEMQWGMHTSPLLHGDRLYLALLHSGGHWVIALDKLTGKEIWKVKRVDDSRAECKQSYTSPCIWQNGSEALLIVHGSDYCTAHRLEDGKEVWRVGDLNPKSRYNATLRLVASPLVSTDLIVIPTAKHGPVVAVKPDAKGMIPPGKEHELWRLPRGTPDVPSPLLEGGLVYLCGEDGRLACLDAKTGKEFYSERTHAFKHRASPVYADGKIYLTAQDGVVTVVKAGPKFEVLATNRLPDAINASPSISNGRIYLRGFDTLYAIGTGAN